jgi:N6-adenosine-specific RNA methylase IME4
MSQELAELPRQHFGAVYVDPPWSFTTWSKTRQTRAASNHYAVMSLDDIKALPVADLAAPDCVLFMWAINSMLPQALDVIEAWGFTYKTVAFTWAKRTPSDSGWHFGLGYWTRQNTESCLLATRGKPKRRDCGVRELVVGERREHSRKPDAVAHSIERLVDGPYLELFARETRPTWSAWGNQVEHFDEEPVTEIQAA